MIPPESMAKRALRPHPTPKLLDVLIIGGGLSGLIVCHELQQTTALSWRLLEARSVLGGRLANDDKGELIDLGGAWIWPSQQPHIKKLLEDLAVRTFPQPDDPSSIRVDGGAVNLVNKMYETLPKDQIQLNAPVTSCALMDSPSAIVDDNDDTCDAAGGPVVRVEISSSQETYFARRVVLAVPPRLISRHIHFDPPLSEEKQMAMASSRTWMAGVTKVAVVYQDRFWDAESSNAGLPSSLGPAFQVYDSSTEDGSVSSLTFFTLAATNDDKELVDQCVHQMKNLWRYMGMSEYADRVLNYSEYHVKRWPKEHFISEDANPSQIHPHPHPVPALSKSEWEGALLFAGSESDRVSPGVMEGAIGAALRAVKEIRSHVSGLVT